MKKTLLTIIAALLLGGVVNAQSWGENPDSHAQPSNTPIVASVTVNGESVTLDNTMRLGAFVNDSLRGIAAPHTDGKFWIQVFYTDANDNITFKFYDGSVEYVVCDTTLTGSDEGYGTPGTPQVLDFTNALEQTISLAAGTNWYSFNVDVTLEELETALVGALGTSAAITIQSQTQDVRLVRGRWTGQLSNIDATQMYMITVGSDCEISLQGSPINSLSVTISNGANWIAYPFNTSITVEDFFAGFAYSNDAVQTQTEDARFVRNRWTGQLSTLEPGVGLIYVSNYPGDRTFTFPASAKNSKK